MCLIRESPYMMYVKTPHFRRYMQPNAGEDTREQRRHSPEYVLENMAALKHLMFPVKC